VSLESKITKASNKALLDKIRDELGLDQGEWNFMTKKSAY
jgi:hypothetical protein